MVVNASDFIFRGARNQMGDNQSCLGRVFNFKLGSFLGNTINVQHVNRYF
jgi:hypothetical protein